MEFKKINEYQEYNELLKKVSDVNFLNDQAWFETIMQSRNDEYECYGVYEGQILTSACFIIKKTVSKMKTLVIKKGPIYINPKSAVFLVNCLRKTLKCDQLIIEPKFIYQINENVNEYDEFIKYLFENFPHSGFYNHSTYLEQRCSVFIDCKQGYDSIYKRYKRNYKRVLDVSNTDYKYEIIDEFDVQTFLDFRTQLSLKKNFVVDEKIFYESLIKNFSKSTFSKIKTKSVKLNVVQSLEIINLKLNKCLEQIDELNKNLNKKNRSKISELNALTIKLEKQIVELKNINSDYYVCAVGIILEEENRMTFFQLHNDKKLNYFKPHFVFYDGLIQEYVNKVEIVDFFGVPGNLESTPKDDPAYGTLLFKSSLGGEFVQYIGHFTIVKNKFKYNLIKMLLKIKKMLK